FSPEELRDATLAPPLPFSKGAPLLRIPARAPTNKDIAPALLDTLLFDLESDPAQEHPLEDADGAVEARMVEHLVRLMRENDAPPEQYARLGLAKD
ncbi:MAG: sulfatase, partial [Chloroflexi bacterium]|nr:sulfatase [Chloroflexota bacterium]